MNATVTIPNNVSPEQVSKARGAFVDSLSSNYGAGRVYAATLVGLLGTQWITMAHDHKGAEGDAMRAERDALYADLKAAGHSNPSVKWKQIKDHAHEVLAEADRAARIAAGESAEDIDAESEGSGNTKSARSPQLRLVEDLTGLYKMCKREAKTLTEAQRKASLHITAALADLGVDVSQL